MLQTLVDVSLADNHLVGSLPDSWSNLTTVSHSMCNKQTQLLVNTHLLLNAGVVYTRFYAMLFQHSVPMQLSSLNLRENLLSGTLPDSWGKLISVSLEQCTHLAV